VVIPAFIRFVDEAQHFTSNLYFNTNRRHGPYLNHTRFLVSKCGVVDSSTDFSSRLNRVFSHNLAVPSSHHLADYHYSDGSRHHINPRVGTARLRSLVDVKSGLNNCHDHHDRHDLVRVLTKSFGVFSITVTAVVIVATTHCVCIHVDAPFALAHL